MSRTYDLESNSYFQVRNFEKTFNRNLDLVKDMGRKLIAIIIVKRSG